MGLAYLDGFFSSILACARDRKMATLLVPSSAMRSLPASKQPASKQPRGDSQEAGNRPLDCSACADASERSRSTPGSSCVRWVLHGNRHRSESCCASALSETIVTRTSAWPAPLQRTSGAHSAAVLLPMARRVFLSRIPRPKMVWSLHAAAWRRYGRQKLVLAGRAPRAHPGWNAPTRSS